MRAHIRAIAIILVSLSLLAASAYPQSSKRKSTPEPSHLYQVSTTDKQTGQKKFGFIDNTGKLVIGFDRLPQTTIEVGEFHEGRALIHVRVSDDPNESAKMNNRVGFIDMTGKVVIAPRFRFASDFSEGLARAFSEDFAGFIDFWGKPVIKLSDKNAGDFHDGVAATVALNSGRERGYIDRSGRQVIKGDYWFVGDFSEGRAGVVSDGKYGFINKEGEMVVPARFDVLKSRRHPEEPVSSGRFREGLACVRLDGLYGYINKQGDFAIPPKFSHAQEFSEGLAWVVTKDGSKGGWIDRTGQWVVTELTSQQFSADFSAFASSFELQDLRYSEGLVFFVVHVGDKTLRGYMDRRGNVVIAPRELSEANPFGGGIARIAFYEKSNSNWKKAQGYIDSTGQFMEEKYGYIDRTGRIIWRSK